MLLVSRKYSLTTMNKTEYRRKKGIPTKYPVIYCHIIRNKNKPL